jgi:hypothetical protein
MSDRCRACKAPIVWARSEHGRALPLDPEPDTGGNIAIAGVIGVNLEHITPANLVAVVVPPAVLERLNREHLLYRSHFATCPYAHEFRRRP